MTHAPKAAVPAVRVQGLSKSFGAFRALHDVSFDMASGEMLVLLGPSGGGKTTLLRCVAGLEEPDEGEIWIGDELVFSSRRRINIPVERRRFGMVFQNYALWPHMSVVDNVAFPLVCRGMARAAAREAAAERIAAVGLRGRESAFPGDLSGGQQQRVALARALVGQNRLVLFDEPLSNLDARVRDQMRLEIRRLHAELGFSGLYVTHDQSEAAALADVVAIINHGRLAQRDTPKGVYSSPSSRFVARFMGLINEIPGQAGPMEGENVPIETVGGRVSLRAANVRIANAPTVIAFRPEDASVTRGPAGGTHCISGVAVESIDFASHAEHRVRIGDAVVTVRDASCALLQSGEPVSIEINILKTFAFPLDDEQGALP